MLIPDSFKSGKVSGNNIVSTDNKSVPTGYLISHDMTSIRYIPAGANRMLKCYYRVALLDVTQEMSSRIVGASRRTFSDALPYKVEEVSGSGITVPNFASVRIKRNTFTISDVVRRLRKLGFSLRQNDLEVNMDGDWTTITKIGTICTGGGGTGSYPPRVFHPEPDAPKSSHDETILSVIPSPSDGEIPEIFDSVIPNNVENEQPLPIIDSPADSRSNSDNATDIGIPSYGVISSVNTAGPGGSPSNSSGSSSSSDQVTFSSLPAQTGVSSQSQQTGVSIMYINAGDYFIMPSGIAGQAVVPLYMKIDHSTGQRTILTQSQATGEYGQQIQAYNYNLDKQGGYDSGFSSMGNSAYNQSSSGNYGFSNGGSSPVYSNGSYYAGFSAPQMTGSSSSSNGSGVSAFSLGGGAYSPTFSGSSGFSFSF